MGIYYTNSELLNLFWDFLLQKFLFIQVASRPPKLHLASWLFPRLSKDEGKSPSLYWYYLGVSKNRGANPQNGRFIMENPIKMDDLVLGLCDCF